MTDGMELGWRRECDDADELLRLMFPGQDPGDFRTDGGWINVAKVRELHGRMRLTLIGQVHELLDIAERHAWQSKDTEEKRRTEGAIMHARKVTAPYNYNGSPPNPSPLSI